MSETRKPISEYWQTIRDGNGVDLELILANLRRTPQERLRRAEAKGRAELNAIAQMGRDGRKIPFKNDRNLESLHYLLAIKRLREETGQR